MIRSVALAGILLGGLLSCPMSQLADDREPDLGPLVDLLVLVDDADVQLDLLKGMRAGLKGHKSLRMPTSWKKAYAKLSTSPNLEVRRQSLFLALVFGDSRALTSLRKTMLDKKQTTAERVNALHALVEKNVADLPPALHRLLDDKAIQRDALRGLAAYSHQATPNEILIRYSKFSTSAKQDAVNTLASRSAYAVAMLDAVEKGTVARQDISAFTARQIQSLGNEKITAQLRSVWGEIRQTSKNKQALIKKYKQTLTNDTLKKANLSNGRLVYSRTCQKCHRLFGEGGKIGPDLTGSNRANLDYILENVLDPSAVIGKDYRLINIRTVEARLISGIIVDRNEISVTVQTVNDRVVVANDDIDEMQTSSISMMPEGQLDKLPPNDIRDLVAYLRSKEQAPLPKSAK